MATPLSSFALSVVHDNPVSIHFAVTDNAAIQYVELCNTTYGIDCIDKQGCSLLNGLHITDVNGPFIHIGLFNTDQLSYHLVNLLCCIMLETSLALPIIASSDLQCNRPELLIDNSLITCIADCVASGGLQPPPNIIDLNDRLIAVEQCCVRNATNIMLLDQRLVNAEREIGNLRVRVANLETTVATLTESVGLIPGLIEQIRILQEQITDILTRCCPVDSGTQACFHYQLLPGQEMLVTPNQPLWLNLPTKILDTTPPIVTPGPLWKAKLLGTCTWTVEGLVRFKLASWCAGKFAKLYIVYCGERYLVDEYIIPFTGTQSVTLNFTLPIPPGCADVHLQVDINDEIAKRIEFASFKGCGCHAATC